MFAPHWNNVPWLLGDMFSVVSRAGESLFYIRVRPWGSKQRQPVVMHSFSPLISCVVGTVSLIPPDSCHSPFQHTVVDSYTYSDFRTGTLPQSCHTLAASNSPGWHTQCSVWQTCFSSRCVVSWTLQVNPVKLLSYLKPGNPESAKHFICARSVYVFHDSSGGRPSL